MRVKAYYLKVSFISKFFCLHTFDLYYLYLNKISHFKMYKSPCLMLVFSGIKEISCRDVLPVYADCIHNDKFWLLMVLAVKKNKITGRYFQLKETSKNGNAYQLSNESFTVNRNSVVRYGASADEYFVLPKFHPLNNIYIIPHNIVSIIEKEVDALMQ